MVKILKGEAMNKEIPNDSMSIIDVRDLAAYVAAAENEVLWQILCAAFLVLEEIPAVFEEVYPSYKKPSFLRGQLRPLRYHAR